MSRKTDPVVFDDENPEWTDKDFAKARPPEEVLPAEVLAQFKRARGGSVRVCGGNSASD